MRLFPRNIVASILALLMSGSGFVLAQSAGSSGTVTGSITDSTAAAVAGATVVIQNSLSGVSRTAKADALGQFRFTNIPYNQYQVVVTSPGFSTANQHVDVRSSIPIVANVVLTVAAAGDSITVEASAGDLVENSATFHVDIDRELFDKLPLESQSSSVSSLLTLASPGVSADSNGLFHGLGDHAENAFYVDGQPITDQQSKVFSNQLPLSAIQSLQVISGAPPAEFGEKTSLVASITTRSGEGVTTPKGSITASYGTFGSSTAAADLAVGGKHYGNFVAVDFLETGRFLDPSEFAVFHDKGNVENFFDRVDFQPNDQNSLHVNFDLTRSWFQTPNSYDNLNLSSPTGAPIGNTDQRAKIGTINVAPFLTHTISDASIVTVGAWVRRDHFNYYPSKNPFADFYGNGNLQTESISQDRSLTNTGSRADYSYAKGVHNLKIGGSYQQTFLNENFNLSVVDPFLNAPCLNSAGTPVVGFNSPSQCAAAGFFPNAPSNPAAITPFNPLLGCIDITRPNPAAADSCASTLATPFLFRGHADIKLASMYGQDALTFGNLSINLGIRGDLYNGLSISRQAQPRLGISYHVKPTGTVARLSYARTMETPFNENLVLSSKGCNDAVIAALVPCIPANFNAGFRNEFHGGLEQSVGKHFIFNGDYLLKYTHNGYDFSVLGATPITFPIEWHNSKISGFAFRTSVPNLHGFSAFNVMSSVKARFFPPQIGGLGATNTSGAPFRIDHDEKFNQTTNLQYQHKRDGPWASFNWRFDSGMVAGNVPYASNSTTPVDLTGLTGDEQMQSGLECGTQRPTLTNPLTLCSPSQYHSSLVSIPAPGTENDDHNPPRIAPRNLFDLSVGQDSIFHSFLRHSILRSDSQTLSAQLTVVNLANKLALYNFLSTFSGTHYVTPRTLTGELSFHF